MGAAASGGWYLMTLTGVLGMGYVLLGTRVRGAAAVSGVAGGITLVLAGWCARRLRPLVSHAVVLAAVVPFAVLTWWSVATPMIGAMAAATGTAVVRRAAVSPTAPQSRAGDPPGRERPRAHARAV